tara:strand:- start:203 stop:373 length:171 start_codon:yes stop_codon:yes gene_type:complete
MIALLGVQWLFYSNGINAALKKSTNSGVAGNAFLINQAIYRLKFLTQQSLINLSFL